MIEFAEPTPTEYEHAIVGLLKLWDSWHEEAWEADAGRHAGNVALISAYTNHVANLSRAVLLLHRSEMDFEAVSLVRTSIECVATSCWLYVFPEKTSQLVVASSAELLDVIRSFERAGVTGDQTIAKQHDQLLANLGKPNDLEAQKLWRRFIAIEGGSQLYSIYRALCSLDHATNTLADQYTEEQGDESPLLLTKAKKDVAVDSVIGIQAVILLRAQLAADLTLKMRRHRGQLEEWADNLGVKSTIEAVR